MIHNNPSFDSDLRGYTAAVRLADRQRRLARLKLLRTLRQDKAILIVAFLAIVTPCILPSPYNPQWHDLKSLVVILAGVALTGLLAFDFKFNAASTWGSEIGRTPIRWFLLLLVWSGLSFAWSKERSFSSLAMLSNAAGLIIAITVATQACKHRKLYLIVYSLVIAALFLSVPALIIVGQGGSELVGSDASPDLAVGTFFDHMLFGSLCMILLPILVSFMLVPMRPIRKYVPQAAVLFCLFGMLVSQLRSAWIGVFVAAVVFCVLLYVYRPKVVRHRSRRKRGGQVEKVKKFIPYLILAAGTIAITVNLLPDNFTLGARLHTMTTTVVGGKDGSLEWREHAWHGELRLIAKSLMIGNGAGTYPYVQHAFTGVGEPSGAVLKDGPTIEDEAHDSYLQLAADLGLPGLLLWIAGLVALVKYGLDALKRLPYGRLRHRLVIGCLSALAAQVVDALVNPSWQFAEVALYFWLTVGILLAAAQGRRPSVGPRTLETKEPVLQRTLKLVVVVPAMLWLIYETIKLSLLLPAPYL